MAEWTEWEDFDVLARDFATRRRSDETRLTEEKRLRDLMWADGLEDDSPHAVLALFRMTATCKALLEGLKNRTTQARWVGNDNGRHVLQGYQFRFSGDA